VTVLVNNISWQALFDMSTYVAFENLFEDKITVSLSFNAIFPIYLGKAMYPELATNNPSLVINLGS
jgi:short-subunit dehydrogenase involved in D-alanine esterification of teichoic acids